MAPFSLVPEKTKLPQQQRRVNARLLVNVAPKLSEVSFHAQAKLDAPATASSPRVVTRIGESSTA